MKVYANDNQDYFPAHPFEEAKPEASSTLPSVSAVRWVGTMGSNDFLKISETSTKSPARNHPSRSLFLLVIDGSTTPESYIWPSIGDSEDDLRNRGPERVSPSGAPVPHPFTLHANAVVAMALEILRRTLDEETARGLEDPEAVRAALHAARERLADEPDGVALGVDAEPVREEQPAAEHRRNERQIEEALERPADRRVPEHEEAAKLARRAADEAAAAVERARASLDAVKKQK